jgi:hypothetical protein
MYITMRRYSGTKWSDEGAKKVQADLLPIIRKVKGFKDYYCVDGGNGVLTTVSVFDDKEGAEESGRTSATWVKENLKSMVPNLPEVTSGTVVAH